MRIPYEEDIQNFLADPVAYLQSDRALPLDSHPETGIEGRGVYTRADGDGEIQVRGIVYRPSDSQPQEGFSILMEDRDGEVFVAAERLSDQVTSSCPHPRDELLPVGKEAREYRENGRFKPSAEELRELVAAYQRVVDEDGR